MKSGVALGLVVVGLGLLVLGSVWTTLFPPTQSWTAEKAARMSEVKARLNDLSFIINDTSRSMHSGPDRGALKAESEELLKEFEQLKTDFESATDRPRAFSGRLRWFGVSLAVAGLIGWYAVNQTSR